MIMFTKLLLAHLLGDFLLQPAKWVVHKEANKIASKYLYFHILIHFGLTMLFLWDMELWWWAVVIALSHFVIDLSKIYANPYFKNKAVPFFVDQVLHLVVLYCCAFNSDLIGHTVGVFREMNWSLVTAVVFVTYPSAIIMAKLLEGMSHRIVLDHKSLPNAGKYIGIIE